MLLASIKALVKGLYFFGIKSINLIEIFICNNRITPLLYDNDNCYHLNKSNGGSIMKKTISFAILHFCVAFTITYLLTGSIIIGGTIALLEPAVNTVVFYFHEKVWKNIEAKQVQQAEIVAQHASI
ncbi:MAG: putative membrane protein [Shewanella psychromarinicola]|jgi:uncharacterized membrane protein